MTKWTGNVSLAGEVRRDQVEAGGGGRSGHQGQWGCGAYSAFWAQASARNTQMKAQSLLLKTGGPGSRG